MIEPKSRRVCLTLKLVEISLEVGDAFLGVELHGDGQIAAALAAFIN